MEGKDDRHFVTALARGLSILRAFASGAERLSNHELAQRCALPKSTVSRLTHTLTQLGFLHYIEDTGRYRLGMATLALARTTLDRLDLREATGDLLQKAADGTGTMISLAIRDELSVLYVESYRSQSSVVTLRLGIGSRLPVASTAAGRAHLVALDARQQSALMQRIRKLDAAAWPALEAGILQARKEFASSGCVSSFGEWRKEINAIAVPITLSGGGLPPLVLNAAAPVWSISVETFLSDVRPQLISAARAVEARYRETSTP
ncbi:IclR family transcriptional regulator [Variovorax ginsengisoli]|uniref:IclR family transcriptional regulator n=1 Tax=Variovorax ginsengisoli TaxID=363844 RepID=A0ABT8SCN8_9BURK|nr:IclR family transcriptional regulator [Variovorax ginsengisoli]MDN8617433.1 IclR family transcriptional regulator [Variovorax ginsengisoli]MDO1536603.1 IclR family transcriptional regulator [Variovorax ginsengisoli]